MVKQLISVGELHISPYLPISPHISQGNTAGLTLGVLSLCLTAGCAVYLGFNRHRVEFSVALLATVGRLVREYPAMVAFPSYHPCAALPSYHP